MADDGIGSVSVEVVPDAQNFWRRFEEQSRAGADEAGRSAGRRIRESAQAELDKPVKVRAEADTTKARAELAALERQGNQSGRGLLSALIPLAPALVPIAGGASVAGAAFVAMGASGILAFKGIQTEIKAATPLGVKYAASLGVAKTGLAGLEKTAAGGVLTGFQSSISKANAALPALNANVAKSSTQLGKIGAELTTGLVAGFNTFAPIIDKVETSGGNLATKFADWAGGPGGAKFAATLSNDFQHLVPALDNLAVLAEHFIKAINPVGNSSLDLITHFSGILDKLPVGVLEAGTAAYVAFKGAVAVTSGIDAATAALTRFGIAEATAAAGAGAAGAGGAAGAAGRAGLIGGASKFIRNAALFEIAGQSAGALSPSNSYQSRLAGNLASGNVLGGVGDIFGRSLGDLANLNPGAFYSDTFGANAHQASLKAATIQNFQRAAGLFDSTPAFSFLGNKYGGSAQAAALPANAVINTHGAVTSGGYTTRGVPVNAQGVPQRQAPTGLSLADYEANLRSSYTSTLDASTVARQNLFQSQTKGQNPTTLASSYDTLNSSLQKTITSQGKWLDQGGKSIFTYKGVSVGANTFADALSKTGGNATKARALIEANVNSLRDNQNQLTSNTDAQARLDSAVAGAATKYGISTDMVSTYAQVLGISSAKVADGTITQQQFIAAIGDGARAIANASTATAGYIAALQQFQGTADTAASRGALIGQVLKAANGDAIDYANTMVQAAVANQQLVTDFHNVKKGVVDWKTGVIDFHNAAAAPLLNDLSGLQQGAVNAAAAVYQHETALGKAGAAADAFTTYTNDTSGALTSELTHLGYTKTEAKNLAEQYFNIKNSGDLKKQIELIGGDHAAETTSAILEDLDALSGKSHTDLYFATHTSVDPNLARVLNINQQHRNTFGGSLTQADGGLVDYYANGGLREQHFAQIAPAGAMRIWAEPETGGEAYIPLAASKRTRSRAVLQAAAARLGGAAFFETGGFSGVDYSGGSAGAKAAASLDSVKSALTSFLGALYQGASQLNSAASALLKAADTAGLNASQVTALTGEQRSLVADASKRDAIIAKLGSATLPPTAYEQLTTALQNFNSERSTVTSAFGGLLNISQLGLSGYTDQPGASAGSILSGLTGTANQAGTLSAQLAVLKAKGLNAGLLGQLAANPTSDAAQITALSGASTGVIGQINAQYGRLNTYAGAAGSTAATALYGAGVSAAQGLVAGLKSQEKSIENTMRDLADAMVNQIKKDLGIHSPSKVLEWHGRMAAQGVVQGIVGELPNVRDAAAQLAGGMVPGAMGGRVGGGGNHFHAYGIQDPVTFLHLAAQDQYMRSAV